LLFLTIRSGIVTKFDGLHRRLKRAGYDISSAELESINDANHNVIGKYEEMISLTDARRKVAMQLLGSENLSQKGFQKIESHGLILELLIYWLRHR
jgi:hypothetical protein